MRSCVTCLSVFLCLKVFSPVPVWASDPLLLSEVIEQHMRGEPAYSEPPSPSQEYRDEVTDFGLFLASRETVVANATIPLGTLIQRLVSATAYVPLCPTLPSGSLITFSKECSPWIIVAGYWDTYVTDNTGGWFRLICYADDPKGSANIQSVEMYFGGEPLEIFLKDDGGSGDFGAGDGVWGMQWWITPPATSGSYLLELVATNYQGYQSEMWPYLEIR